MAGNPTVQGPVVSGTSNGGMSITPSDSTDISFPPRAGWPRGFSVGVAGTVSLETKDGSTLTFLSGELAVGVIHPLSVKRVNSTGTAATNMKVYW